MGLEYLPKLYCAVLTRTCFLNVFVCPMSVTALIYTLSLTVVVVLTNLLIYSCSTVCL
jgi:hypothetical protein